MLKKKDTFIDSSKYISRDLSWMKFNERVLDQSFNPQRTLLERLKFLAITASNLDEFFQIRVGSLYNYIDYGKVRIDYTGLREEPFRKILFTEISDFHEQQDAHFMNNLRPLFETNGFMISSITALTPKEQDVLDKYFHKTIYPMLTPMVYDGHHSFPILLNKVLIFGVVSNNVNQKRLSFVQIPQNLPRFFEIKREGRILFIPIEEIIRWKLFTLYKNVEIQSINLFRITRNGDFSLEESDDMESRYIDEIKRKLKTRQTGRVVRIEIEKGYPQWMMNILEEKLELDKFNVFSTDSLIDYTSLWHIVKHKELNFKEESFEVVSPLSYRPSSPIPLLEYLKQRDVLLHHPYNSIEPFMELIEQAADDPFVLSIKITIYRLAKQSRIADALLKAAENGKHVSVLFEVKARFDEENNINQAQRLQKAGCFVIYGVSNYKTHTKLCLIVRKEDDDKVTRYVHLSSGNYNEVTSKLYTDISLLTTQESYANDVSEFFNAITGHSKPQKYTNLLTAPGDMRDGLIHLINKEAENAINKLPSGIVIKINSLQDLEVINALYRASSAGVKIKLIVRGMCCLKPGKKGLSENITVKSIVGDFLEHSRVYYFHNLGNPLVYGGSADVMVRSLDRRIESLYLIIDPFLKQEAINILFYNLKDNANSYYLQEDSRYTKDTVSEKDNFSIHKEFFKVSEADIQLAKLF
ncbi:MAG: polyphosphate kinase 1 [Cytophagales bacterium]|nr:MAG: polyphosphate kinase 1 [Cytophagales bacterium]